MLVKFKNHFSHCNEILFFINKQMLSCMFTLPSLISSLNKYVVSSHKQIIYDEKRIYCEVEGKLKVFIL